MINKTRKREIGDMGESITCQFLEKHGYKVVERNYLRKWGEIDIVAIKEGKYHFVEVKTACLPVGVGTHVTFRPEEHMHPWKLKRLGRVIQTYLLHKKLECEWQLDLITVRMDMTTRRARVELIENIVI